MKAPHRDRWTFTVELPASVEHGGRFMARLLKHLLRAWGVKATAIVEAPLDGPGVAQDAIIKKERRRPREYGPQGPAVTAGLCD